MKKLFGLLILAFVLLSCSRDWNSPLENDSDLLNQPQILSIDQYNAGFKLQLNYSYSSQAIMLFERKIADAAYEPVTMKKLSTSVFADTTLNMELNHDLTYRLKVQKGEYYTEYSEEKATSYTSTILNAPTEFTATTVEMLGVRLDWLDNSTNETGYKIEKRLSGGVYTEIASRPANTMTYTDEITSTPGNALNLSYRIHAFNTSLNSAIEEQAVIYSGLGAPTNLIITDSTFYHFTIAWTQNSTIATGYQIERKKDEGNYSLLASVVPSIQTYTDHLTETGSFSYRVRAKKDDLYSSYTNIINTVILNTTVMLINDNFDTYLPTTFPSSGGWIIRANGAGDNYQIVTNQYSHSGSNSFQLLGSSNYGSYIDHSLPTIPSTVFFEAWIRSSGDETGIGFYNLNEGDWGTEYAIISYTSGKIFCSLGDNTQVALPTYIPNQWYKIRLMFDSIHNNVSVWIDDQLKLDNIHGQTNSSGYQGFRLLSGYPGAYVYFDDVKVWYIP